MESDITFYERMKRDTWSRRLKSMDQWRAKLRTLAAGGAVIPNLPTIEAVGIYVFRYLRADGTLNVDPLQAAP